MGKKVKVILLILIIILAAGLWFFKGSILPSVTEVADKDFLLIYEGTDLNKLADSLVYHGFIKSKSDLLLTAKIMRFQDKHVREGRFKLKPGWNNVMLLNEIAKGKMIPVKLVINPVRKIENLAALLGKNLEHDSIDFLKEMLLPEELSSLSLDTATVMTLFIPNTYEFFWHTSPKNFLEKMASENKKFWEEGDRLKKLDELHMSKEQVYTLASIVDRETRNNSEKPVIAGLYLNRLKDSMRLQADPTAVFAFGDFNLRRITERQITFDSPYNTYKVKGLPPGPIFMATIAGIDAVLNYEKHNYIYMVARPDYSGLHDFSETFESHREKANKYRDWLTTQGLGL